MSRLHAARPGARWQVGGKQPDRPAGSGRRISCASGKTGGGLDTPARLGHRLSAIAVDRSPVDATLVAAPTPLPVSPRGFGVIQPLLTRDDFRSQGERSSSLSNPFGAFRRLAQPQQLTDIDNLIHQYHQHAADDTDQGSVHTRLRLLDQIEHHAYAWFDQNRDTEPADATHSSLRALLASVQPDHEALLGATDAHGHELWTPDRGTLGVHARQQLDADWNNIRTNQGQIRIHDNPIEDLEIHDPGFRNRTLSSFARLLSRPHGRGLVHDLDTGGHQVNIRPMHPAEQDVRPYNAITDPIGGHPRAVPDLLNPLGYHAAGGGGSALRVDPRLTDTVTADFDAQGRRIVAPTFITLGHELIHALHNQQGTNREQIEPLRYQDGGDRAGWKDREEYDTIAHDPVLNENLLRGEHGLSLRHGHDGGRLWEE